MKGKKVLLDFTEIIKRVIESMWPDKDVRLFATAREREGGLFLPILVIDK